MVALCIFMLEAAAEQKRGVLDVRSHLVRSKSSAAALMPGTSCKQQSSSPNACYSSKNLNLIHGTLTSHMKRG